MRRTAAALTMTGLIAALGAPAIGQEPIGVLVRPPAEVDAAGPAPAASRAGAVGSPTTSAPPPGDPDRLFVPGGSAAPLRPSGPAPASPTAGITILPPLGVDRGEVAAPPRPTGAQAGPPAGIPAGAPATGSARPRPTVPGRDGPPERRAEAPPVRPGRERPGLLGGMLDRLAARPPAPLPAPRPRREEGPTAAAPHGPGRDGAPPPAAEAEAEAIRRRLERMIAEREGGRLASFEVLVVGDRVHIRARAARPWQRPALRRGLDELPMPAGFRSTIEVR